MKARWLIAILTLALPALAGAHPGHDSSAGLIAGIVHPLFGVDHLLAMFAVGAWAARMKGCLRWQVPMSFMTLLLVGYNVSMTGPLLGAVEQGIAASVVVLGMLVATTVRLPALFCVAITGCFALLHGFAHGAELPSQANPFLYISGFTLSSTALLAGGFVLASSLIRHQRSTSLRWIGAALTAGGCLMLVS
ncbi:MAG: HupE/UreJ family protein [Steroidobacteraceae bacterium]